MISLKSVDKHMHAPYVCTLYKWFDWKRRNDKIPNHHFYEEHARPFSCLIVRFETKLSRTIDKSPPTNATAAQATLMVEVFFKLVFDRSGSAVNITAAQLIYALLYNRNRKNVRK